MSNPSTEAMEQYVRERWKNILVNRSVGIALLDCGQTWGNWQAAYNFTVQREREIAEKREEVALVKHQLSIFEFVRLQNDAIVHRRILAVLESQLADLQSGMKGGTK